MCWWPFISWLANCLFIASLFSVGDVSCVTIKGIISTPTTPGVDQWKNKKNFWLSTVLQQRFQLSHLVCCPDLSCKHISNSQMCWRLLILWPANCLFITSLSWNTNHTISGYTQLFRFKCLSVLLSHQADYIHRLKTSAWMRPFQVYSLTQVVLYDWFIKNTALYIVPQAHMSVLLILN